MPSSRCFQVTKASQVPASRAHILAGRADHEQAHGYILLDSTPHLYKESTLQLTLSNSVPSMTLQSGGHFPVLRKKQRHKMGN